MKLLTLKKRTQLSALSMALIPLMAFTSCNSQVHFRSLAETPQPLATPTPIPIDEPPVVIVPPPPVIVPPPPVIVPPPPPVIVPPPPVIVPPPPVIVPPPPVIVPPPPIVVVPPPPPIPVPQPVQKTGLCKADSSTELLTCMNCVVPHNPPAQPQLSEKGQSLLEIMTIGCSVPNKSSPKNYVPPTRADLLARMNRLSPTLYPDTFMTASQKSVISGLKNSSQLQQRMFGGLWYQPPYSNDFETYFGASIGEVVTKICYDSNGYTPPGSPPLQSAEFLNCTYSKDPMYCKEKPEYILGNIYRDQLRNAMKESISHPYVAPTPLPSKNCSWENFEGDYELGAESVLARWLVSNYKIGIEIGNLGGKCESLVALPVGADRPRGLVKMAAYICK